MWQKLNSSHFQVNRKKIVGILTGLCIIGFLLVGCGSVSASNGTVTAAPARYAMSSKAQISAAGQQSASSSSVVRVARRYNTGRNTW